MEPSNIHMEEELDSDISSIRAEIRNLKKRRRFLSSSLLSSNHIQKRIASRSGEEISPLARAAGKHAETNHHRIAFSATTFPFKDPSPNSESPNLLGLRLDVCSRNGRFAKPYYVLLKRVPGEEKRLRVHRHTIPAFISMEKLEKRYLPSWPDESVAAEIELKPWKKRKQDLQGLVQELRVELVAWHLRVDAVDLLRERLGGRDNASDANSEDKPGRLEANEAGITSLVPTALETKYVRLGWEDGRVGRFKISNAGIVERAVVIGDHGRDKKMEEVITGGDRRIETLLDRLMQ